MREVFEGPTDAAAIRALRQYEALTMEYKGEVPRPNFLAKMGCAFANTNDGILMVGGRGPKDLVLHVLIVPRRADRPGIRCAR